MSCAEINEHLGPYMDRELAPETHAQVASHLADCATCTQELEDQTAMRDRLRAAVRGVEPDARMEQRIRASIRNDVADSGQNWARSAVAVAAVAIVCLGVAVSHQYGHFRLTTASQESYTASLSQQVDVMMRVALGDHLHCAFFRKYPDNPPPPEQMVREMGPQYKDLIDVVKRAIPADYRVEQAHRCSYHKRNFVHVIAKSGSRMMSLIIADKRDGETFVREAASAVSVHGMNVYQARAQRFAFAGFETPAHLVYVISDLDSRRNLELLTAFAPGVVEVLKRVESGV